MRGSSVVIVALIALGLSGGAQAMQTVFIVFQMPSKNIGCGFTDQPDYLRCDIGSGIKPAPTR